MTQTSSTISSSSSRTLAIWLNRRSYWFSRRWMLAFSIAFGLLVGLPFLAPILMAIGWEGPAQAIYAIYSFLCHQMPQRSYFLFGQQFTYSLATVQDAWQDTLNPLVLRQFIGNPSMGWKVAWSDRMVSMYTSILIFAWIWYPLRRRLPRLSWQALFWLALPMAVDGTTHMISDLAGIGQGFRDHNAWLAVLTNQAFSADFYSGDAWGSFNSLMRLITGILLGLGITGFGFPYLDAFFKDHQTLLEEKFDRAGISLS